MPKRAEELSAKKVASLKVAGSYAVGGVPGLYLAVAPSGARSWLFRYSIKQGGQAKRREMGLGGYPAVGLSDARERARAAHAELRAGRDPLARLTTKGAPSFWDVAEDLLATVEAAGKNPKHRQQWRSTLKTYAAPLHAKRVVAITTEDVASILAPIWQTKPETASRLRGRIERVLSVAKAKGFRSGDNPAAWRDNLEPILGKRRRLTRGHHGALPYEQVSEFVGALRRSDSAAALALEFTILTAARTGEVIGARLSEIDLERQLWTVPAERMKAGREHRVPLSGRAIELVEAAAPLRRGGDGFVFPGQSRGGSLSNMAMAALLKRIKRDDITVHGFRSCFRDWAGEVSSFPNEVCEMALAHAIKDKAEKAYRRGDLFEKRRAMMDAWAEYCAPQGGADAAEGLTASRKPGRPLMTPEQAQALRAEGKWTPAIAKALDGSGISYERPPMKPGRKTLAIVRETDAATGWIEGSQLTPWAAARMAAFEAKSLTNSDRREHLRRVIEAFGNIEGGDPADALCSNEPQPELSEEQRARYQAELHAFYEDKSMAGEPDFEEPEVSEFQRYAYLLNTPKGIAEVRKYVKNLPRLADVRSTVQQLRRNPRTRKPKAGG